MDRVENPMIIDHLWAQNKMDYQHEVTEDDRHYCFDCGDDIEDEGYELDGDFVCKHCCLDRCVVYSWGGGELDGSTSIVSVAMPNESNQILPT